MASPGDGRGREPRPESEHARAVAEVMDDQKRRREARERTDGRSEKPFFAEVGLLVAGIFFFYLLLFSPTWVAPNVAPEIGAERTRDGLRFYLFTVARQVDDFRETRGRLPADLGEIAGVKPGTEYERISATEYRIRYSSGDRSVSFVSSRDPAEFLGDAGGAVLGGETGGAGEVP